MLRIKLLLVLLLTGWVPSTVHAQSEAGHVYLVVEWKAHPGEEGAYSQTWIEFLRPLLDRTIQMGGLVSYLDLVKNAGNMAEATHLQLYEFESWESYGAFQAVLDRASRAAFGRPWIEVQNAEFVPYRDMVTAEIFVAPPTGM